MSQRRPGEGPGEAESKARSDLASFWDERSFWQNFPSTTINPPFSLFLHPVLATIKTRICFIAGSEATLSKSDSFSVWIYLSGCHSPTAPPPPPPPQHPSPHINHISSSAASILHPPLTPKATAGLVAPSLRTGAISERLFKPPSFQQQQQQLNVGTDSLHRDGFDTLIFCRDKHTNNTSTSWVGPVWTIR